MMLGLRLSFSLTYLSFEDRVDTALRKTSDSDTSRVFLIKICSSTALKNCEATKTFISSIAFSGVLFTFMVSLIQIILFSRALINVAVEILVNTSYLSENSILSMGSTTVICSLVSLIGAMVTLNLSYLYWVDAFNVSIGILLQYLRQIFRLDINNNSVNLMASRALILGGYGNFGRMISKALVQQNVPITIAGRSSAKLQQYQSQLSHLKKQSVVDGIVLDANTGLKQYLMKNKPKVVVNTCGPFQPIQQTNFNILEACIECGVNYIDLSDGRDYIREILKYDEKAKSKNITAITGASTAPGLSSAIIQKFLPEFSKVDSIYYGFSPGQKSTRGGQATAKGVMSYVGKPINPYGKFTTFKYGWQDLYVQYYPGVGYRLMGNVDHPDFDIFPSKYGVGDLHFHAGVESKLLHLSIWFASWMVRFGAPLNLPENSGKLLNVSHYLFDWMGSDVGVMHMRIKGNNLKREKYQRKWFLVARNGEGPNVATVPAILLTKKICTQNYQLPGVNPCVGLVTLDEYLSYLKKFNIETFSQ